MHTLGFQDHFLKSHFLTKSCTKLFSTRYIHSLSPLGNWSSQFPLHPRKFCRQFLRCYINQPPDCIFIPGNRFILFANSRFSDHFPRSHFLTKCCTKLFSTWYIHSGLISSWRIGLSPIFTTSSKFLQRYWNQPRILTLGKNFICFAHPRIKNHSLRLHILTKCCYPSSLQNWPGPGTYIQSLSLLGKLVNPNIGYPQIAFANFHNANEISHPL